MVIFDVRCAQTSVSADAGFDWCFLRRVDFLRGVGFRLNCRKNVMCRSRRQGCGITMWIDFDEQFQYTRRCSVPVSVPQGPRRRLTSPRKVCEQRRIGMGRRYGKLLPLQRQRRTTRIASDNVSRNACVCSRALDVSPTSLSHLHVISSESKRLKQMCRIQGTSRGPGNERERTTEVATAEGA
jgi:hypothetical protein